MSNVIIVREIFCRGMEYIETYAGNYYHYNCFKCLTTDEILKETDLEVKTAEHYDWR